jgi:hypothetical protein
MAAGRQTIVASQNTEGRSEKQKHKQIEEQQRLHALSGLLGRACNQTHKQ